MLFLISPLYVAYDLLQSAEKTLKTMIILSEAPGQTLLVRKNGFDYFLIIYGIFCSNQNANIL